MLPHRHGTAGPRRVHVRGRLRPAWRLLVFFSFGARRAGCSQPYFSHLQRRRLDRRSLTITSRNPIYSALWFASVVLATAGLFLLAGAPFLAAGTIIVYAGAIIVTFLFVIMLAQSEVRPRTTARHGPRRRDLYLLPAVVVPDLCSFYRQESAGGSPRKWPSGSAEQPLYRARDIAEYARFAKRQLLRRRPESCPPANLVDP